MSSDARRQPTEAMDEAYAATDDFPVDYEESLEGSVANGGSESDEEMGESLQQLQIVQSPIGPGIQIQGEQVRYNESAHSLDSDSVIIPTQKASDISYVSAVEPANVDLDNSSGTNARPAAIKAVTATTAATSQADNNTKSKGSGAKPKTNTNGANNPTPGRPRSTNKSYDSKTESNTGNQSIINWLKKKEISANKHGPNKVIPNVVDWFSNPVTGTANKDNTQTAVPQDLQPLPQRSGEDPNSNKRRRVHSSANSAEGIVSTPPITTTVTNPDNNRSYASVTTNTTHPTTILSTSIQGANTVPEEATAPHSDLPNHRPTNTAQGTNPTGSSQSNDDLNVTNSHTDNHTDNPTNKSRVSFQDEQDQFLPMNSQAIPFYKRARGCFCAEVKALERAAALEESADNGKPPRWAYQLAPYPNYVGPLAKSLADIKHRHAIEMARELARVLRESSREAAEQGRLNWTTVSQSYGGQSTTADRAESRLVSMSSKERERERTRMATQATLHSLNPITNEDIQDHFKGVPVAVPTAGRQNRQNQAVAVDNNPNNGGPMNAPAPRGAQGGNMPPQHDDNQHMEYNNARGNYQPNGRRNNRNQSYNRSRSRSPYNSGRPRGRANSNYRSRSRGRQQDRRFNNNSRPNMRGGQSTRGNNRQQRNNNPQWGQQNAAPNQPRNNTEISDIVARVMAELDRQRK